MLQTVFTKMQFQFHKGTIKTNYPKELAIRQTNFNSIKVRLKRNFKSDTYGIIIFQFHKGTIKTRLSYEINMFYRKFQFHKGTIKTGLFKSQSDYYDISIP